MTLQTNASHLLNIRSVGDELGLTRNVFKNFLFCLDVIGINIFIFQIYFTKCTCRDLS